VLLVVENGHADGFSRGGIFTDEESLFFLGRGLHALPELRYPLALLVDVHIVFK